MTQDDWPPAAAADAESKSPGGMCKDQARKQMRRHCILEVTRLAAYDKLRQIQSRPLL